MATASTLADWFPENKPVAPTMQNAPAFYRNLQKALDVKRAHGELFTIRKRTAQLVGDEGINFSTSDVLSLGESGRMREEWMKELATQPFFSEAGSRIICNSMYTDEVEREIAAHHNSETCLIMDSGFDANGAILSAIPRAGDALVYDELVHASMHEGMLLTQALSKTSFRHNDPDSLRETLLRIRDEQPLIRDGQRCVLILAESVYSMNGDVTPLREFVAVVKEVFPDGNAQFILDEAHGTGIIGTQGRGLACALGLEDEIAIRMHTYGKAAAAAGAVILCNSTVKLMLCNFARAVIYSTAPTTPQVAGMRAFYNILKSGEADKLQATVVSRVKHLYRTMSAHPAWEEANDAGILTIPHMDEWETAEHLTHIVPVMTRQRYNSFLAYHLFLAGFSVMPIDHPVVPKGKNRIRIIVHAKNTEEEVEKLAKAIGDWAQEMLDIEESDKSRGVMLPSAVRQVNSARVVAVSA